MLEIVNVPKKILRKKSKTVNKLDQPIMEFISDLADALLKKTDPPGVGLSAIQVGNPLQIFFTYLAPKPYIKGIERKPQLEIFINPKIIKHSENTTLGGKPDNPFLEGCLSIPLIYGPVPRFHWVDLSYQTFTISGNSIPNKIPKLQEKETRFKGFAARVIQHEFDHLQGILFTDYTLKHDLKLYMEQGDSLIPIQNPKEIIKW